MNKEDFINLLMFKCNENNIQIDYDRAEQLYIYKELLLDWNEKINLTAITEDEDIVVKHFVDSLLCLKYINKGHSIIDVGTGAGFPGIVLAIYFSGDVKITLLDSLNKRITFLDDVISKLELKNIETIHGRAEEVAHKEEYREKYDVAIARAVAPLNILLEYLSGYVKKYGKCICMKSMNVDEEMENSKKAAKTFNLALEINENIKLNHKDEQIIRNIIVYNKIDHINNKYPRSFCKIKKSPL